MLAMANRFPQATNGNPIAASSEGVVVETNTSGAAPLGGAVVLERCSIRAVSEPDGETDATGIWSKSISGIIATDCTISARQTWIGDTATPRKAHGVLGATPEAVSLVGGQITSFDVSERENDQFDIRNDSTSEVRVRVRGTAMSKWKGAIGSSERPSVNVQRMVSVAAPIATAILYAKVLTTMEVEITKTDLSLMQLDNCRVLTATLSGGTGLQSSLPRHHHRNKLGRGADRGNQKRLGDYRVSKTLSKCAKDHPARPSAPWPADFDRDIGTPRSSLSSDRPD